MNHFSIDNSCTTEMTASTELDTSIRLLTLRRYGGKRAQAVLLSRLMKTVPPIFSYFKDLMGGPGGNSAVWPCNPGLKFLAAIQWLLFIAFIQVIAAWYMLICRLSS